MKYTINNLKLVDYYYNPEKKNFTGVVKDKFGDIAYYVNGKVHREGGPAIIFENGDMIFRQNNFLHREDGAAIIQANGSKSYWIDGKNVDISTDQELQDLLILRMFE